MRYNFTSRGLCIVARNKCLRQIEGNAASTPVFCWLPSINARISTLFKPFIEFITIAKTIPFSVVLRIEVFCMHQLTAVSETLLY